MAHSDTEGSLRQLLQAHGAAKRLSSLVLFLLLVTFIFLLSLFEQLRWQPTAPDSPTWVRYTWGGALLLLGVFLIKMLLRGIPQTIVWAGRVQGFSCPRCNAGFDCVGDLPHIIGTGTCPHCDTRLFSEDERLPADETLTAGEIEAGATRATAQTNRFAYLFLGLLFAPLLVALLLSHAGLPSPAFWSQGLPVLHLVPMALWLILSLAIWIVFTRRIGQRYLTACPHCHRRITQNSVNYRSILVFGTCLACGNNVLRREETRQGQAAMLPNSVGSDPSDPAYGNESSTMGEKRVP